MPALEGRSELDEKKETREGREDPEALKLSNRQVQDIEEISTDAIKEGVLCFRDKAEIYRKLSKLSKEQQKNAAQLVKDHIERKREHRDRYSKKLQDEAKKLGIPPKEIEKHQQEDYDEKTGKERREEEDKEMKVWLEEWKKKKQDIGKILEGSEHYFKNGKLSDEGKKIQERFKNLTPKEAEKEKRKVLLEIKKMDNDAEGAKENHNNAKYFYEHGDFEFAEKLMKKNIRLCQKKQNEKSPQLQEFLAWAKSDLENLKYEQGKKEPIEECLEDTKDIFDDMEGGKKKLEEVDFDDALLKSTQAVALTTHFLKWTYDGKLGPYEEGKQEKPRSDAWVTPYMKRLQERVTDRDKSVNVLYDQFAKKQVDEEEEDADGQKTVDETIAQDSVMQLDVKAHRDQLKELQKKKGFQKTLDQSTNQAMPDQQQDQSRQGEQEPSEAEHAQEAQEKPVGVRVEIGEEAKEEVSQRQVGENSEQELGEKRVMMKRRQEQTMTEARAKEVLRSEADVGFDMTQQQVSLDTEQKLDAETERRAFDREEELIDRLEKEGEISKASAKKEKERIRKGREQKLLGKALKEQEKRKGQAIVRTREKDKTKEEMEEVFDQDRAREEGGEKEVDPEKKRQEMQKKKRRIIENVRV